MKRVAEAAGKDDDAHFLSDVPEFLSRAGEGSISEFSTSIERHYHPGRTGGKSPHASEHLARRLEPTN